MSPATADTVLKLIDHALDEAPHGALEWVRGWLTARATQRIEEPAARRDTHPSPGCALAVDGTR
jgi:hypothetical protein